MLVVPQPIRINWSPSNKKYYESVGYVFTGKGTSFIVDVINLSKGSGANIQIKCDYCGQIFFKSFKNYHRERLKNNVNKDACIKCINLKREDSNLIKYGVKNVFELNETKIAIKNTNNNKYGVDHYSKTDEYKRRLVLTMQKLYGVNSALQSNDIRERCKNTLMKNYGVDSPLKSEEVRLKLVNTNLSRYGVEYAGQIEEGKIKRRETNIKRYGCEFPLQNEMVKIKLVNTNRVRYGFDYSMQNEDVKNKTKKTNILRYGAYHPLKNIRVKEKMMNTVKQKYNTDCVLKDPEVRSKATKSLFANSSQKASRQQKYLCELLNGTLNYPVGKCFLDITFVNEKIYIEYDGGGHDISVKSGNLSREEFLQKERNRDMFLKYLGWKRIRISSPYDYLPSDEVILVEIEKAKESFKNGHNHYNIHIGTKMNDKNYGTLRKLK